MQFYQILLLLFPALAWAQNPYQPPAGYQSSKYSGFPGGNRFRRPQSGYRPVYADPFPGAQYNNDCGNQLLTCVATEDCSKKVDTKGQTDGQFCPPYFMYETKLGYCATVALIDKNNLDAVQACESQDSRLLFFENSAEFKQIGQMKKALEVFFFGDKDYWLDAYYDDKSETWIRRTTREPIIWEQIFTQLTPIPTKTTNIEVVREIDAKLRCLTVKFDATHPELLVVTKVKCTDLKQIACKLGFYTNKCRDNKKNVCCFSPTSDFYLKNTYAGPGSALGDADANCFLEITKGPGTVVEPCAKVLATLGPTTATNVMLKIPFRIGSSFFYLDDTTCIGKDDRKAVISNRKVHDFLSRYLVLANLNAAATYTSFLFGLQYKGHIHKVIWQNGRPYDYYNETFWNGYEPNFDKFGDSDKPVCGHYVVSPIEFEYKWELTDVCVAAAKAPAVCELPIRFTDLMPTTTKVACGMRHRRGVLARSAYASGHELQALYGEFPWQAAIYKVRNLGGLRSTFVCSGVLIDKSFVITAAHCVVGPSKDFTVVLGEYAVGGGVSILERQVTGVSDILVYPGYESTNPLVHDIALVQLDRAITLDNYPQIGLACLPYPDILYRNTGAWDCFTVGWNGKAGALQRVESSLLSKRDCRIYTRAYHEYHDYTRKTPYGYGTSGYDKVHGYHYATYQKHHYFSGGTPDLLCTESVETKACVNDPAAVLVCRQAALHADTSFGFGNRGYGYHAHRGHRRTNARIVNAYGRYRFDSEKWYVMGLSHSLSPCSGKGQVNYRKGYVSQRKDVSVFTPVHEYLPFLHAYLDAKITSAPKVL
ncbi:uncharacterized protein LOC125039814 [Penaeus chinensis]|uniref:uncharacterized protein LOC125039814 n=1 Tax=Penaeus chinensis TaxID=139456 RepID=UPI001FB6BC45|nr:uncharacterized protein LOC125039814 [Penaeus chinensis]